MESDSKEENVTSRWTRRCIREDRVSIISIVRE